MKKSVYKELKRLYPNATGFAYCKTQYGTFYFAKNKDGRENITDTFKSICFSVACNHLIDELNRF